MRRVRAHQLQLPAVQGRVSVCREDASHPGGVAGGVAEAAKGDDGRRHAPAPAAQDTQEPIHSTNHSETYCCVAVLLAGVSHG